MKRRSRIGRWIRPDERYCVLKGILTAISLILLFGLSIKLLGDKILVESMSIQTAQAAQTDSEETGIKTFTTLINPRDVLLLQIPALKGVSFDYTPELTEDLTPDDQDEDQISEKIKIEISNLKNEDLELSPLKGKTEPTILIYHTHTLEAYKQVDPPYVEKGAWRTEDPNQSVIRVGTELTNLLENYGYSVIHDTTNHEPPKLSTAYDRSLLTMQKNLKEYPSLRLFIDLHRDAYDTNSKVHDVVQIDGKDVARVMFVVGTGERYPETEPRPNWKENYKLALKITNELNSVCKNFARDIRVKTGRYNQQVGDMCLLIEVGHNANTLQEALNAIPYVARCIDKVLSGST